MLDLFSANEDFSIIAALAGAKEVIGVEFSQERIHVQSSWWTKSDRN